MALFPSYVLKAVTKERDVLFQDVLYSLFIHKSRFPAGNFLSQDTLPSDPDGTSVAYSPRDVHPLLLYWKRKAVTRSFGILLELVISAFSSSTGFVACLYVPGVG